MLQLTQCQGLSKLSLIFVSVFVVTIVVLLGCSPSPTPETTPPSPPQTWSPEANNIVVIPRERLEMPSSCAIDIPLADYVIIPISVGEYEHLKGWTWDAKGTTEDYLDSWIVDSRGNKISESGRVFNFGVYYESGLSEGTYYIYLSNEFNPTSAKQIILSVNWD